MFEGQVSNLRADIEKIMKPIYEILKKYDPDLLVYHACLQCLIRECYHWLKLQKN